MLRKYLFFALFLLSFKGFAQTLEFEIDGMIVGLDTGIIQFYFPKRDSLPTVYEEKVPIKNGKFTFKGQLAFPDRGLFIITSKETIETNWIYIDIGKQAITIHIDSAVSLTSDSRIFSEYKEKFKKKMTLVDLQHKEWKSNYVALAKKHELNLPNNVEDSMQVIANLIQNHKDSLLLDYIKQNPLSYVSLGELLTNSGYDYKPIYDTCFLYLDNKLKINSLGQEIYIEFEKLRATYMGAFLPTIPVVDLEGHKFVFDKKDLKEYILCDFWFSSCGYCIMQFPRLNDIYTKWQSKGFDMISISTDRKTAETAWLNAIKKHNLLWSQYWDIDGLEAKKLLIRSFPTNFLLDKTGKIVAKNIGLSQLEAFLELNLKN